MKITTVVPWMGSNRMLAQEPGKYLTKCKWVGVTCAGGMSEVPHFKARTIVVNDKHRHVINLAWTIRDHHDQLVEKLATATFHPDELQKAQEACLAREETGGFANPDSPPLTTPSLSWAVDYFIAAWMSRNGRAGTLTEFKTGLALRYNSGGGDSAVRVQSAIDSIAAWSKVMQRCTFSTEDLFVMLEKCHDLPEHGFYVDATFPDAGHDYKWKLSMKEHELLPTALERFKKARVVMRWYDHQLIRRLYPTDAWEWHYLVGRDQHNNAAKPEVILVSKR